MNTVRSTAVTTLAFAPLLGLSACNGISLQDKNTAVGAAIGGAQALF